MQIAGLFKPSLAGKVPPVPGEVRRACGACRWVNIFHVLGNRPRIELKA
jgi:hypothetical protein